MTDFFSDALEVYRQLAEQPPPELDQLVDDVLTSWEAGGKVISFGNGGSASDSLHFTAELVAKFRDRPIHRPAISLNSNPSTVTATANDWSYEELFARQLRAQAGPTDVILGITTSGTSANVIQGLKQAVDSGLNGYGLTGDRGRDLAELDVTVINMPSDVTAHIQQAHIAGLHYVCHRLDQAIN